MASSERTRYAVLFSPSSQPQIAPNTIGTTPARTICSGSGLVRSSVIQPPPRAGTYSSGAGAAPCLSARRVLNRLVPIDVGGLGSPPKAGPLALLEQPHNAPRRGRRATEVAG